MIEMIQVPVSIRQADFLALEDKRIANPKGHGVVSIRQADFLALEALRNEGIAIDVSVSIRQADFLALEGGCCIGVTGPDELVSIRQADFLALEVARDVSKDDFKRSFNPPSGFFSVGSAAKTKTSRSSEEFQSAKRIF